MVLLGVLGGAAGAVDPGLRGGRRDGAQRARIQHGITQAHQVDEKHEAGEGREARKGREAGRRRPPVLTEAEFYHSRVVNDLAEFKRISDVIVANRLTDDISDVVEKVYTRDLFGKD